MIPARTKAPHDVRVVERWIGEWSREVEQLPGRLRNLVATTIVAAMLERARASDGGPLLVFRGGGAMQLRIGLTARASKDLDAAVRDDLATAETSIRRCLTEPWNGFTGTIARAEEVPVTWMEERPRRLEIKLFYRDKNFVTIPLEIAVSMLESIDQPDFIAPAERLDPVGMPTPDRVACLPIRWQIAEKLHACTDPGDDGRGNQRPRDLVDLLHLRALTDDLLGVRIAALHTFESRSRHAWPPSVVAWRGWESMWAELRRAQETRLELPDAVGLVNVFIQEIEAAR